VLSNPSPEVESRVAYKMCTTTKQNLNVFNVF